MNTSRVQQSKDDISTFGIGDKMDVEYIDNIYE